MPTPNSQLRTPSRAAPVTLRLWLLEKTEKAVRVATSAHATDHFFHWIPRSLISYSRTEPAAKEGELPIYIFTLPEWKVDQLNLWEYVEN